MHGNILKTLQSHCSYPLTFNLCFRLLDDDMFSSNWNKILILTLVIGITFFTLLFFFKIFYQFFLVLLIFFLTFGIYFIYRWLYIFTLPQYDFEHKRSLGVDWSILLTCKRLHILSSLHFLLFFQGSERLLLLASDSPSLWSSLATKGDTTKTATHSPLVRHLGSCVHHW